MSDSSPESWRSGAIRLVAAGLGTVVGGPLGAALGSALGSLFSEQATKILETYGHKGGEALTEFGIHYFADQISKPREHPPLETVVQQAVRFSLEDVRRGLPADLAGKYSDWFANWDSILSRPEPPVVIEQLFPASIPAGSADQARALDQFFQSTFERLDAQARAGNNLSIIAAGSFRNMPPELLLLLIEKLPHPLRSHFNALVALPEHQSAWVVVQQNFQDSALSALAKLDAVAQRTETKVDRILEIQQRELARALHDKDIAEAQAREERAKREDYEKQYRKLLEDALARTAERGEHEFARLLADGDLEGAVAVKNQQIERRRGEVTKLAQDWSELGRLHHLRFAWAKALECYRAAWHLDQTNTQYGLLYAYSAQKQNRIAEAIDAYSQILPVLTEPSDIASTKNNLAILYRETQRMNESEQSHLDALTIYRRMADADPQTYLPYVATTLNNVAILYGVTLRPKKAEQSYQEALAIRRRLAERQPEAHQPDIAGILNNLSLLYNGLQRIEEGEHCCKEALDIRRHLAQANPAAYLPEVATTLNNMAILCRSAQRGKDAEHFFLEALNIQCSLAEANSEVYLPAAAATLNNVAVLFQETERPQEAEGALLQVLGIRRRLADANPAAYLADVASTLNELGTLYRTTKRTKEAEQSFREALSIRRDLAQASPEAHLPDAAMVMNNLANLYIDTRQLSEAEQFYDGALAIHRGLAQINPDAYLPTVAATLTNMAVLYLGTDRAREASESCGEARAILEPLWQRNPELHGNQLSRINSLAALVAGPEHAEEACQLARGAVAVAYDAGLKESAKELVDRFCAIPPE
jgi:tetratricopeptide (TPR) repeat protein